MLRFLIVPLLINPVWLIDVSLDNNKETEINELVDVFSDSSDVRGQYERIKNVPTNSSGQKSETAWKFVRHYNSLKPVAVLVDDTTESRNDAKNFMQSVFKVTPNAKFIHLFVFKFNTTGVSPVLEIIGNNSDRIETLLDSTSERESSYLGPTVSNGSVAFFAILNAAATLPQNSAMLIFIDRKIADEDLASHTGLVKKKNIKVYAVWGGSYPTKSSEERLIRELCEYSGGLFLVNTGKSLSSYNYRLFLENGNINLNTSIVLSKNNLLGASDFTFPIDSKVTGIHISISPFIASGTLSSPDGYIIDILKNDEIADYSTGSFGKTELGLHEVHLNVTTAQTHSSVGFWRLKLRNARVMYNVTVFVYTKLSTQAYFVQSNTNSQTSAGNIKKIMKLGISGYITSISNISFVDQDGQATLDNVEYTFVKDWLVTENSNSSQHIREVDVEISNVPEQPIYALIRGKDAEGHEFERLTYVSPYDSGDIFPQPTLTIDVGVGSELITTPGKFPVIIFEVTNHKTTAVDVRFFCRDERAILRSMQPYRKIISPEETAIVRVTLTTKYGSYQDEVTFSATIGSESFIKKATVDVGTQMAYDNVAPELDYTYYSDCSKVVFSKCSDGTWTIKIKARDTGSGLLQVTTDPRGIYFPYGFTSGTREEVVGYYSGTCCSPELQIISLDRQNNRKVLNVNAYLAFWGPAQIAALVLGILLLILIIVLVVYLIVRCVRKRDNYDLPTYRGGRI